MDDYGKGFKLILSKKRIEYRQKEFFRKIKNEFVKIPNKKNINIPIVYTWIIYRIKSVNEDIELCSFVRPTNDIGNGLNNKWIELNLNFEEVFDFNYKPQENDNLILETNEMGSPYISFIFEDNKWKTGYHIPFQYEIEELNRGEVVKIINI